MTGVICVAMATLMKTLWLLMGKWPIARNFSSSLVSKSVKYFLCCIYDCLYLPCFLSVCPLKKCRTWVERPQKLSSRTIFWVNIVWKIISLLKTGPCECVLSRTDPWVHTCRNLPLLSLACDQHVDWHHLHVITERGLGGSFSMVLLCLIVSFVVSLYKTNWGGG